MTVWPRFGNVAPEKQIQNEQINKKAVACWSGLTCSCLVLYQLTNGILCCLKLKNQDIEIRVRRGRRPVALGISRRPNDQRG